MKIRFNSDPHFIFSILLTRQDIDTLQAHFHQFGQTNYRFTGLVKLNYL